MVFDETVKTKTLLRFDADCKILSIIQNVNYEQKCLTGAKEKHVEDGDWDGGFLDNNLDDPPSWMQIRK